jgi:plasmid stabilization system protein ParE
MLNKVVVCYRITGAAIDVVRVLYGGRDFETIMTESDD